MTPSEITHKLTLRDGTVIPAFGLGTWCIGDNKEKESEEISSIRTGIQAGVTVIDTAEMYGNGKAETVVGKAIQGIDRSKLYLISKVLPHNAGRKNLFTSFKNSIKRMGVEYLDLYLLHWIGPVPFKETVECFQELKKEGLIRNWGVSNFDVDDMENLLRIPHGDECIANQVLYHIGSRGIEYDLSKWLAEHDMIMMSYSPLARGGMLRKNIFTTKEIIQVALKHNCTTSQVLLAWNIRDGNTLTIPKSGSVKHTLENAAADKIILDDEDLYLLDKAFPPPICKVPLDKD